ncbi:MAG: cyclic-di-AMP receptor [Thermomicrobiales bacterium]
MKLIFAVVQGKDADSLRSALLDAGYRTTQINSAGGFLRESNATFLVGVDNERVPDVLRIVKQTCYTRSQYVNPLLPIMEPGEFYMPNPVEVQVGGAAVFICNVNRYERIFS